jgi:hypothetical protein
MALETHPMSRKEIETRMKQCIEKAEYCESRAATAVDPDGKKIFVAAAAMWRDLANHWIEALADFPATV